jgi:prepilin-type N-terminal cleavage/methylation domain-containing protein
MTAASKVPAAPPRARRSDAGFTLTELLVTIVLFAIVGGAITMAATSGLRHQREVQDRGDALAQARTALQRIDRDIRSAAPLAYASRTAIATNQTGSATTNQVCYWVQATSSTTAELRTRTTPYPSSTPCLAATTSSTVLLRNLVNTDTSPVFTPDPSCADSSSSGGYDASCVTTITVQISVQPSSLSQPVTVSDNGTELRNT